MLWHTFSKAGAKILLCTDSTKRVGSLLGKKIDGCRALRYSLCKICNDTKHQQPKNSKNGVENSSFGHTSPLLTIKTPKYPLF